MTLARGPGLVVPAFPNIKQKGRQMTEIDKLREKLAELTTIANAIPPACGLAKELVEKRIEGVKKEVQNNGKG